MYIRLYPNSTRVMLISQSKLSDEMIEYNGDKPHKEDQNKSSRLRFDNNELYYEDKDVE